MSDIKRIKWRCRRGLQEMDIALKQFLEQYYSQLSPKQDAEFERLLDENDLDILDWLFGRKPTPEAYGEIVTMIRKSLD